MDIPSSIPNCSEVFGPAAHENMHYVRLYREEKVIQDNQQNVSAEDNTSSAPASEPTGS